MVINEIYNQGDMETIFYLWDPFDPTISTTTATGFDSLITSIYSADVSSYPFA
jgi:hypothetical protein